MTNTPEHTPLMQQYHAFKAQYPEPLLFFQVGDFYELFFDDARRASAFLGIALTSRGKSKGEPIPLCGVPVHARDFYCAKLIRGGFSVAICDQLTEPVPGKVVDRGVTQVLTPGTLSDPQLLDPKSASYLCSFFPGDQAWGLVFAEMLTAQLFATVIPIAADKVLEAELGRFFPDEVLIPATKQAKSFEPFFKKNEYVTSAVDLADDAVHTSSVVSWFSQLKGDTSILVSRNGALAWALATLHTHLRRANEASLSQFSQLSYYEPDDFMQLDPATQKTLELVKNSIDGTTKNTLFSVLDGAVTPMGSRMIKKWIMRPLVKQEAIVQRQEVVRACTMDVLFCQQLEHFMKELEDFERVVGRIAINRATINDYRVLMHVLQVIPSIKKLLVRQAAVAGFAAVVNALGDFSMMAQLLSAALHDDASSDRMIKNGFNTELDRLRGLVDNSQQALLQLEQREQQRTGITSLKVRYNQIYGYYIEITKANLDAVPADYIRRQSLVGKERFTTPELQTLAHDILHAQADSAQVEKTIFESIKREVHTYVASLRKCAYALAGLDALLGFARVASAHGYVCPQITQERDIVITAGRHPVVEVVGGGRFIPNDTVLTDEQSLWVITGPNMGGKSTYLRQVALMCVMAQCGSFVPARKAQVPLLDRIFTRIGSGDNLAQGKSTFLVEMEETATICTYATAHSLVILDEVGRGTSTFDGLAIAQAVIEYIHARIGCRCLFATHYHALALLKDHVPGIESYYAASTKTPQGILFLYKIMRGVADGSFGLEVAKLAKLPDAAVARAQEILQTLMLAEHHQNEAVVTSVGQSRCVPAAVADDDRQLLLATIESLKNQLRSHEACLEHLKHINYDDLSPKKAFDILWALKGLE